MIISFLYCFDLKCLCCFSLILLRKIRDHIVRILRSYKILHLMVDGVAVILEVLERLGYWILARILRSGPVHFLPFIKLEYLLLLILVY